MWPTWANIISSEIEGEFYNLGVRGVGNVAISCRIAEANIRYNFCETDLVIVMFSSFNREDRYLVDRWVGNGNIYNQQMYSQEFVKKFADPDFYIIRDLALIEMSTRYLKSLPCESIFLAGFDINNLENSTKNNTQEIIFQSKIVYKILIEELSANISMYKFIMKDRSNRSHSYVRDGKKFDDGHPNTKAAYEYLKELKFPLTDKSKDYVELNYKKLLSCKTDEDIIEIFGLCDYKKSDLF
jgi:hypothetical protein